MNTIEKAADFTPVKIENSEAATAQTATASEPVPESRENSPEGAPEHGATLDVLQVASASGVGDTSAVDVAAGDSGQVTDALTPMSAEEIVQRDKLIGLIDKVMEGVPVVNDALREIRDLKLWRGTHSSFPEFCREMFDFSEARASQLITHATQCAELKNDFSDEQIPTSERAIRELRRAKPGMRVKVLEKALALADGQRPKTSHILEARAFVEGVKPDTDKAEKAEVITPEEAMSAAETLKQFLEKCERDKLTIGDAHKISELTKGIADIAAIRLLAV
jgi:hypothetical protein